MATLLVAQTQLSKEGTLSRQGSMDAANHHMQLLNTETQAFLQQLLRDGKGVLKHEGTTSGSSELERLNKLVMTLEAERQDAHARIKELEATVANLAAALGAKAKADQLLPASCVNRPQYLKCEPASNSKSPLRSSSSPYRTDAPSASGSVLHRPLHQQSATRSLFDSLPSNPLFQNQQGSITPARRVTWSGAGDDDKQDNQTGEAGVMPWARKATHKRLAVREDALSLQSTSSQPVMSSTTAVIFERVPETAVQLAKLRARLAKQHAATTHVPIPPQRPLTGTARRPVKRNLTGLSMPAKVEQSRERRASYQGPSSDIEEDNKMDLGELHATKLGGPSQWVSAYARLDMSPQS